jgi:predicted RND superfamily exporter protein
MSSMIRFAQFVISHAWATVVIVLVLTVLAASRIVDLEESRARLVLDASFNSLLPTEDEGRIFYDRIRSVFGSNETLLLVIHRPGGVFEAELLKSLGRIGERIEDLDGVDHVMSLANAPHIRSVDGVLEVGPLFDEVSDDRRELDRIRTEALDDPLFESHLLSADARSTALLVYLLDITDTEFAEQGIDQAVRRIAAEELTDAEFWLTGGSYLKAETTRFLFRDLTRVVPLVFGLMALIALIVFRSVRGVLVPVTTVGIALIWALAVAAEVDPSLNLVTVAVPALILVVGFAYTVHVLTAYYHAVEAGPRPDSSPATQGLSRVALATLLTGVTTAAGFLSLMTSPLSAIKQFGLYSAIGVTCAMLASLFYAPAVLGLLPAPKPRGTPGRRDWLDRAFEGLAAFDVRHRQAILAMGALVTVFSVAGMTRIQVNTDTVSNFSMETDVRRSFEAVNQLMGGGTRFYVVLETDDRDAFKEPANLREMESLQEWLISQPEIGTALSVVDYVKLINRGFHDNDPEFHEIPDSKRLVSQLLVVGATDDIERLVDFDYQIARMVVRATVADSGEVARLVERVERRVEELPGHIRGRVTGNTVLVVKTIDDIAYGQALSLSSAVVIIYAILALLFTSVRMGFLAMIPNILPVLVYFGALGWAGISLNTTTGLIACLVLGIAVDDTVHFLTRFNSDAKKKASETEGVRGALTHVGRPVTYTSIALCLGFLILTTSSLKNQAEFGALAAFTLAVAWFVDLTFTPALASRMRIVTLWDVLTLDLGEDPVRAIPLFHGLSKTQARVAALMTAIVECREGHRLIEIGQKSDGIYVIVDGCLRSSVERDGRPVLLNKHERGDVVGEVGIFYGERTANVDCETDVRLLRMDESDLSRLKRRYPRLAAQLYRNLSKILAGRLVAATPRVR